MKRETICRAIGSPYLSHCMAGLRASRHRDDIPLEVIRTRLGEQRTYAEALNACDGRRMLPETIEEWRQDADFSVRAAAMKGCKVWGDAPLNFILAGLGDPSFSVQEAALDACKVRKDISPREAIQVLLKNPWPSVELSILEICRGWVDAPWEVIESGLRNPWGLVRMAAVKACKWRKDITPEMVSTWLVAPQPYLREGALDICQEMEGISPRLIWDRLDGLSEAWY